jgi:hypothetical protein
VILSRGGLVELFFTDRRRAVAAGVAPGIDRAEDPPGLVIHRYASGQYARGRTAITTTTLSHVAVGSRFRRALPVAYPEPHGSARQLLLVRVTTNNSALGCGEAVTTSPEATDAASALVDGSQARTPGESVKSGQTGRRRDRSIPTVKIATAGALGVA